MVVDLTHEVKTGHYKAISITVDAAEKPEEKVKKPAKPKAPKEVVALETMTCPKCKTQLLLKGNTAYGCAQFAACGFKIPFEIFEKKLTDKNISDLLLKGKTGKIKGLKLPQQDDKVEAALQLDAAFNIVIL